MSLKKRIFIILGALAVAMCASFAFAVSYNAPCGSPQPLPAEGPRMKAFMLRCYGSPEVLRLEEVPKPTPGDDEVLIQVHATSVNPTEWHRMRGSPYFVRLSGGFGAPEDPRISGDAAGVVAVAGKNVTRFKPGDAVFGRASGAFAEYALMREDRAALKPENVTFEQAAAVPVAAVTALQALRDRGRLREGQHVLINGASGGVGTYAVQIAKLLGAEVTGVCSTRNVELVRSLGAAHVVDYTRDDFTQDTRRYDLIVDNVGSRSLSDLRRVLKPDGILVIVGAASRDPWIGPMLGPISASVLSRFVDQEMGMIMARMNASDLEVLAELMRDGKLTSVIDRRYTFNDFPAAIAYLEEGRARGKVIVNLR
jgi:NADPH:quinone reductase-like Zn-dependent oxidoreductase